MSSDTPRTDALYAPQHQWEGWPPNADYHRMTDHARELERELAFKQEEPELLKAIFRDSLKDLRSENKSLRAERDRWKHKRLRSLGGIDDVTDQDLPPANRTWANLWQAKYWKSRQDLVNANRGIARLLRRMDAAKAQRDYVAAENESLLAENRRLAKIISDLEAIRELDC